MILDFGLSYQNVAASHEPPTAAGRQPMGNVCLNWPTTPASIFSSKNEPEGGSEAIRRQASFLFWFVREKPEPWESGNPVFGFPLFHGVVGAVGMWESRSDFQGRWEERHTWGWFSSLSTARHFHRPPPSCAPPRLETGKQFVFGFLHLLGCLRVTAGSQLAGPTRQWSHPAEGSRPRPAVGARSPTVWHTSGTLFSPCLWR